MILRLGKLKTPDICTLEKDMKTRWRQYKERFQVIHQEVQSEWLKRYICWNHWNSLEGALVKATGSSCGWTKDPDIKKHSGRMMMLVIVLMRRGNYGGVEKEHKSGEI